MALKRRSDSNDDPNPSPLRQPKLEDPDHYDTPNLNEEDMEAIQKSLEKSFPSKDPNLNADRLGYLYLRVTRDTGRAKRAGIITAFDEGDFVSLAMNNKVFREDCRKAIVDHDPHDLLRNRASTLAIAAVEYAITSAWERDYVGDFAKLLVEAINKTLESSEGGYGNLGSIIQSSGYGKSRMVGRASAYPRPDNCVKEYFSRKQNVLTRDRLFFLHLFRLTLDKLDSDEFNLVKPDELPGFWRQWLEKNRSDFYRDVTQKAVTGFLNVEEVTNVAPKLQDALAVDDDAYQRDARFPTRWDVLCSTLAHLLTTENTGKSNVLCLSMSTASHFPIMSRPKYLATSARQAYATFTLFAPFTTTPFDIMESFDPSTKTFGDLEQIAYLAQFGRPLWRSIEAAGFDKVMHLAIAKLSENGKFSEKFLANFAAISTRVLIDAELERETGHRLIAMLVHNHLRTVFSIPEHREYMRTGVPSEPIIAEAAAVIMHQTPIRMTEILQKLLHSNLIGNGERGELVARALLIMAIDAAIHKQGLPIDLGPLYAQGKTAFHKAVSVKAFIEALFAQKHHRAMMESLPENVNPDNKPSTFEKAFKNGYHPFHWNNTMAFLAFIRGAAVQFPRNHWTFDMGVLVAILPEGKDLKSCPLSATGKLQSASCWMHTDNPGLWETKAPPVPDHDSTPVATFLVEFGIFRPKPVEGDPSAASTSNLPTEIKPNAPLMRTSPQLSTNKDAHSRYAFIITGCTAEVYSVIKEAEKDIYRAILSAGGLATETPRYKLVAKTLRAAKPTISYNTDYEYNIPGWKDLEVDVDQGSVEVLEFQGVDGDAQVEQDTVMDILDGGV
ncbi:hypothetical protein GGX14DRAFT_623845 [Mycena pura]|uniref:Uncharacterized protein n=1 Tax=Mycena pura TaxID=153505 RepID=A0AAD6VH13_9AGAR|nr:hypothetical protein GGX14DRAFT_623845 [Mycena pura]